MPIGKGLKSVWPSRATGGTASALDIVFMNDWTGKIPNRSKPDSHRPVGKKLKARTALCRVKKFSQVLRMSADSNPGRIPSGVGSNDTSAVEKP
jgi:hypothetical protein